MVTLVSREAHERPADGPKLDNFVCWLMKGVVHLSVPHVDGFSSDCIAKSMLNFLELDIESKKTLIRNGRRFLKKELNELEILNQWIEIIEA